LNAVIDRVSEPRIYGTDNGVPVLDQELKALVFDSQYDPYR